MIGYVVDTPMSETQKHAGAWRVSVVLAALDEQGLITDPICERPVDAVLIVLVN